jgi:hypothetical protein
MTDLTCLTSMLPNGRSVIDALILLTKFRFRSLTTTGTAGDNKPWQYFDRLTRLDP